MLSIEYGIITNNDDCVGCNLCEVACKQENKITSGHGFIRAFCASEVNGERQGGCLIVHCSHCVKPLCIGACSQQAIVKRNDGIVQIVKELCNGCAACIKACPVGAIQYDNEKKLVRKCNLCSVRLKNAFFPACVTACPRNCILIGAVNDICEKIRNQRLPNWYCDSLF